MVGKKWRKENIRRECEDNIKMNFREIRWSCMGWIDLAEDRNQRRTLVNTIMNLSESNENLVVSHRWVFYSKREWPTDRQS
jgi:hypothetical protein